MQTTKLFGRAEGSGPPAPSKWGDAMRGHRNWQERHRDWQRRHSEWQRRAKQTGDWSWQGFPLWKEGSRSLESPPAPVAPPRRERKRKRKKGKPELSAEERAYKEAQRAVNARIGFIFHFIPYLTTCLFLTVVAGFRVAMIVALSWGIGVASHAFAVIVPQLRRRWINDEVGKRLHNSVTEERRTLHGEHSRSLEQLSASIAHEIRNPITAAKSLVQQMGEDPAAGENIEYARVALDELERVERSVSHLLRYAREEELEPKPMRMMDVVESSIEALQERLANSPVVVHHEVDSPGEMKGDADKLRRVLINLVSNAADALEESGVANPRVDVLSGENLAGTEVWVRVKDNGPGMDAQSLDRVFQPFYTSKDKGTGLGLAISKKLVDAHGGMIEVSTVPGQGAEFLLVFPKSSLGAEA